MGRRTRHPPQHNRTDTTLLANRRRENEHAIYISKIGSAATYRQITYLKGRELNARLCVERLNPQVGDNPDGGKLKKKCMPVLPATTRDDCFRERSDQHSVSIR